jgi:hypothetical protein
MSYGVASACHYWSVLAFFGGNSEWQRRKCGTVQAELALLRFKRHNLL